MIEGSAVVACPIGANRYVGVWQSVPPTKQDLQGRILRRRRHRRVAEPLVSDVGQRCATSAMHERWRDSAARAVRGRASCHHSKTDDRATIYYASPVGNSDTRDFYRETSTKAPLDTAVASDVNYSTVPWSEGGK